MNDRYKIAVSSMDLHGKKLQPGDDRWRLFNASFDNYELPTHDLLDVVYYGQAITTQHKNNWRTTENYLAGQHIGLDFDTEDERSTLEHLSKDPFVNRYAAFVHTTISHTPETPRARVVFVLDQPIMQAKNYALAASALLWMFGTADRQCKDAVRFFYGAPGCDFAYFANELPLEIIKRTIANYQASGANEKRRAQNNDYHPPATQQEVAEALRSIDPWKINYDEWVGVLMAIHSEFGTGGLGLAESWAAGKPGEVAQKWRSFDSGGNEAGRITIATLFKLAIDGGWERP